MCICMCMCMCICMCMCKLILYILRVCLITKFKEIMTSRHTKNIKQTVLFLSYQNSIDHRNLLKGRKMSLLFSSSLHFFPPSAFPTSLCYQLHHPFAAFSSSPPAAGTSLSPGFRHNFRTGPLYCSPSSSMSLEESTSTSQVTFPILTCHNLVEETKFVM